MGHGVTWLSFLPGYEQLQRYLQAQTHNASLLGNAVVIHLYRDEMIAGVVLHSFRTHPS